MNMIKVFGNLTIRVWMIAAFVGGLLFFGTWLEAAAQTSTTRTANDVIADTVTDYISQFGGKDAPCFGKAVSIGGLDLFKQAAKDVEISTDASKIPKRNQAQLAARSWLWLFPWNSLLFLRFDPLKTTIETGDKNSESIFHELIHELERGKGVMRGEKDEPDEIKRNRNTLYVTNMVSALRRWKIREKYIRDDKETPEDRAANHLAYDSFLKEMADLKSSYAPDANLKEITGFRVDPKEIHQYYLTSDCNENLKKFAQEHATWEPSPDQPDEAPPAGGVVSTKQDQTSWYCTNNPNIRTEFQTPPWLSRGEPDHPTSLDYGDMIVKLINALKDQGMEDPRLGDFMNVMTKRIWTAPPEDIDKHAQWDGRPAALPDMNDKQAIEKWRERMAASFLAVYQRTLASGNPATVKSQMSKLGQRIKDFDAGASELAILIGGGSVPKRP